MRRRPGLKGEVRVGMRRGEGPSPSPIRDVLSPLPAHKHPLLTGAQPGVAHSRLWGSTLSSGVLLPTRERPGQEAPGRPGKGREGHVASASAHLRVTSSSLSLLGPGL